MLKRSDLPFVLSDDEKKLLLAEVEDILRALPSDTEFGSGKEENRMWIGRTAAVLEKWDFTKGPTISAAVHDAGSIGLLENRRGFSRLKTLLWQARADLRMQVGQLSSVIPEGQVFEYFDELRKTVETARVELFFVDPYLDAEFVSRYLPLTANGVKVRLLAERKLATLVPATEIFVKQRTDVDVQIRSSATLHDRYLFVDKQACHLSGASFKDGAKKAPATLTQIVDGFQAMFDTYERLWNSGKHVWP